LRAAIIELEKALNYRKGLYGGRGGVGGPRGGVGGPTVGPAAIGGGAASARTARSASTQHRVAAIRKATKSHRHVKQKVLADISKRKGSSKLKKDAHKVKTAIKNHPKAAKAVAKKAGKLAKNHPKAAKKVAGKIAGKAKAAGKAGKAGKAARGGKKR
jgi:hypothetical protein